MSGVEFDLVSLMVIFFSESSIDYRHSFFVLLLWNSKDKQVVLQNNHPFDSFDTVQFHGAVLKDRGRVF